MRANTFYCLFFCSPPFLQQSSSCSNKNLTYSFGYQFLKSFPSLSFSERNNPSLSTTSHSASNVDVKGIPSLNDVDFSVLTSSGNDLPSVVQSSLSNGFSNMRIFEKNIFFLMALISTAILVLEVLINDIRQLRQTSDFPPQENDMREMPFSAEGGGEKDMDEATETTID